MTKMPSICNPSPEISSFIFASNRPHRVTGSPPFSVNQAPGSMLPSPSNSPFIDHSKLFSSFPVLLLPPVFLFFLLTPSSPPPLTDKYYVVDAGYPNTRGYLAPYKGTHIRYHLPDFQHGQTAAMRAPRGSQETFNYRHSSLPNIIEQTFGVWKARWALLRDMHVNFTYDHQVQIVIASMAVHNYIRRFGRYDGFNAAEQESYNPRRGGNSSEEHDERIRTQRTNDDDMYMAAVRDIIAQDIMESSL
ncbi:hypothetical protein LXL04_020852 [Taraxacum kok-saghyz]